MPTSVNRQGDKHRKKSHKNGQQYHMCVMWRLCSENPQYALLLQARRMLCEPSSRQPGQRVILVARWLRASRRKIHFGKGGSAHKC